MTIRVQPRCPAVAAIILIAFMALAVSAPSARALIMIGRGNAPVPDHDWPFGTLEVANLKSRVGWWEGPPFGGGQWQFLYRGDAAAFQEALDRFAKIRAPELRLVVHEGPQENQFLKDDRNAKSDAHFDWSFTVWVPRNWNMLYNNPLSISMANDPTGAFRNPVDPPILDVYVASATPKEGDPKGIDWKAIKIPTGLTIVDERASAAGYSPDDGSVLRGDIYDMLTSKPIPDARVILSKLKGQNDWEKIAEAPGDVLGRFELKKAPDGPYQLTVAAAGYVERSLGYITPGNHALKQYTVKLAPPATIKGTVRDTDGKPIGGARIRAQITLAQDGRGYILPSTAQTTSDNQGGFELAGIPQGYLQLFASEATHYPLDIFRIYAAPTDKLDLILTATGTIKGKVAKLDGSPATTGNVTVQAAVAPGGLVGTWGGGMNLKPDGTFEFKNVPPGTYRITATPGRPSPDDPNAKEIKVEAGKNLELDLITPR